MLSNLMSYSSLVKLSGGKYIAFILVFPALDNIGALDLLLIINFIKLISLVKIDEFPIIISS